MNITKETTTATITALGELALRLELEGAAFSQVHSRDGALLAEERLEQAADLRRQAAAALLFALPFYYSKYQK